MEVFLTLNGLELRADIEEQEALFSRSLPAVRAGPSWTGGLNVTRLRESIESAV